MAKILRNLIFKGQVSLAVMETTELVNGAIAVHGTGAEASRLLGGLLTCGAYLASSLKEDTGSISLTVKAKDGDGAVSVSADKDLHIRGYADGTCEETLVGGTLTVVREDGFSRPFVGTCDIACDDVSDILARYFGQSEQIPTAVCIFTEIGEDGKCKGAGGVVMQLLPDASDEAVEGATELFESYRNYLGIYLGADAEEAYGKLFASVAEGDAEVLTPVYKCNCSESKIKGVLSAVGREELLKICDEVGEVKVHCHYCNTDYTFDRTRIEEEFK